MTRGARTAPLIVIVLAFLAAVFFVPMLRVLVPVASETIGLSNAPAMSVSRILRLFGFTAFQAFASSAIAIVVGFPLAFLVAHYEFPGRRLLYAATLVPFVLPSIIVVVAMVGFFGTSGLVQTVLGTRSSFLYGFAGIVLAHVYYNFSIGARVVAPAWASIDQRHVEAAKSLGDRPLGRFLRITLPLLLPSIINGFLLMFLYTFLSFGIVLVFGGVQATTVEVAIYQRWFLELDLRTASLLAVLQLVFLAALLFSTNTIASRRSIATDPVLLRRPALRTVAIGPRILAGAYLLLLVVFLFGPLIVLAVRAITALFQGNLTRIGSGPTARDVSTVLRSSVGGVIVRSVLVALASGGSAFLIAATVALSLRRRTPAWFSTIIELPMAMSLVTLAVGFSLLWGTFLPPLLRIILVQIVIALPLSYRVLRAGVDALGERPLEVAESLGASPVRRLVDIELPLLRPVLLNSFAYALAISFADLTAVLVVGRGRVVTFPVAIYRLIGFRSFSSAIVLAFVYLILCGGLFWVLQSRTRTRRSS